MHQDQVVQLPAQPTQFLTSDDCGYSGYLVNDHVLDIQHHPDFTKELCRGLIIRRTSRIGEETEIAFNSLRANHDVQEAGQWNANFLRLK
jgi:GMP synthase-like glutamine amidotransferase